MSIDRDLNKLLRESDLREIEQIYERNTTPTDPAIKRIPWSCRNLKSAWSKGHDWTVWFIVRAGQLLDNSQHLLGHYIDQERICRGCGEIELRQVRTNA